MADAGKMTLLEIVQNILSSLTSDEVNSIGDSIEALQVVEEVRAAYYDIITNLEEPHRLEGVQLLGLSDTDKPNYLNLPANVESVFKFFYDIQEGGKVTWEEIHYITPDEFVNLSNGRSGATDVTLVEDFNGASFYIKNDQYPKYYTSFDDQHIICDAWKNSVNDTLLGSKTFARVSIVPTFTEADNAVPDLPAALFPLLLSEAKSACFINLKQIGNNKEDTRSRIQRVRYQNKKYRMRDGQHKQKNYARIPRK